MIENDQENRHTIQVVANRTGLSADVIRAWERRYQAVEPQRTATRRRLYSDRDIQRLRMLKRATLSGRRIGDIARIPFDRLVSLIREDAEAAVPESPGNGGVEATGYRERALAAAMTLDSRGLEAQLSRASMELDIDSFFEEVLTPILREVGERWLRGQLSIAHEHMTTSIVRTQLDSVRAAFSHPSSDWRMIATAPSGQHHELGAMKAAVVGAIEGWQSTYLGCDLPATEIVAAAEKLEVQVVALSLVFPDQDSRVASALRTLGRMLPKETRVIVGGGNVGHYRPVLEEIEALTCSDMRDFRRELRRISGNLRSDRANGQPA